MPIVASWRRQPGAASDGLAPFATFTVIEVAYCFVYAFSDKSLSVYLRLASVLWEYTRTTGGVFIGFAAFRAIAHG